ncbi:4-hydroxythreonine-4-phosphate dehydrogenase [Dissulfuribacter thermophilus]|uniref:4-hydroxythreonine-4-phosphate dehydrogenase n=1 Tax=Dissulfuribacter thermophilus TaxID=1156395 RepID=A0A1B9F5A1_9BACT|nr:4-hydroxythreonine-4-phosphate dehydrogenase PdxA [Dissulfuribacter thermophilus]OCC15119.1 4-hydroxythreonine-4-phosphate dehydrogenase [Dissulfuribacter thermophilus]
MIGITMGCPAGIGPEIIIKVFSKNPDWMIQKRVVVYGDPGILKRAMEFVGFDVPLVDLESKDYGIPLIPVTNLDPNEIPVGKATPITGMASYEYVVAATKAALNNQISAVVTCPITKEGLRLCGLPYPGHTEILGELTNTKDYLMMLRGPRLAVVLVTIHCKLREVPKLITEEKVFKTITIVNESLKKDFGVSSPKIAVSGLNPHAGEGGLFGDEDDRIIKPAIEKAREKGIDCSGPYPPDTVFYRALKGEFHACVAQYHDQGLIPLKLVHFEDGVNVTLNLPIVRTSVDHGTAYDIAGSGTANPISLEAAINTAKFIVQCRKSYQS